jgi:carbonic anhydrase
VTAALEADPHEPVVVRLMLAKIVPALRGLQREDVTRGVEANVRQTVTMLKETPGLDREIQAGRLIIVGGIYSLADGRVRLLGNESITP